MTTRLLADSDAPALEAFLNAHRDGSLILRSNARKAGLEFHGAPFQAQYVAAFNGGRVVAVAAHVQNGMLILQAPTHCAELSRQAVAASGRPVTGLLGPLEQVREARTAVGLAATPALANLDDGLYALELSELVIPDALSQGALECRPPRDQERAQLYAWRVAYAIEVLGGTDSAETRATSAQLIDWQIAEGNAHVAVRDAVLLSYSAFNCTLPEMVQLGGIYTPPEQRSRGYARAAVAATLRSAREQGATRAVLFSNTPSALRCYAALGFRQVGEFGLVLFR